MTDTIRWDQDADGIVTLTLDDPNQRANTMNDDFRSSLVGDRRPARRPRRTRSPASSSPPARTPSSPAVTCSLLIQVTDENAAEFAAGVDQDQGRSAPARDARQAGRRRPQRRRARRRPRDRARLPPPHRAGQPEVAVRLPRGHPRPAAGRRRRRPHRPHARHRRRADEGAAAGPAATTRPTRVERRAWWTSSPPTPEEMLDAARAWIKANPESVQPWDAKGYRMPGGTPSSPKLAGMLPGVPGQPAQAAQGRADAGAAPHHVRGGRGRERRHRHRVRDRGPLLRQPRQGPGREEHDPGVLVRPELDQRRRLASGRYDQRPAQKVAVLGAG